MYKENKEETAWSMDRFNDYINKHVAPVKNLESDWAYNTLTVGLSQHENSRITKYHIISESRI